MAHIDCSFYSESLLRNVHVIVYLPTVSADDMLEKRPVDYYRPEKRFRTMYLLHGMYGDCLDWPLRSGIERYAQEAGLAVVMPSAENSFYANLKSGERFEEYVGEELPAFMNKMFPLSSRREDTCVAGLSMGGYGAYRIGLTYPERFGRIASLSGALDSKMLFEGDSAHMKNLPPAYRASIPMEGNDLAPLVEALAKTPEKLPRMYMTVGTEDFIYPLNESFYAKLQALQIPVTYEKYPGIHDWNFWDAHIQDVIRWLAE